MHALRAIPSAFTLRSAYSDDADLDWGFSIRPSSKLWLGAGCARYLRRVSKPFNCCGAVGLIACPGLLVDGYGARVALSDWTAQHA
jgi:hypothetical protein